MLFLRVMAQWKMLYIEANILCLLHVKTAQ